MSLKRKRPILLDCKPSACFRQGPIVQCLFAYLGDTQHYLDWVWLVVRCADLSKERCHAALCAGIKCALQDMANVVIPFVLSVHEVQRIVPHIPWHLRFKIYSGIHERLCYDTQWIMKHVCGAAHVF